LNFVSITDDASFFLDKVKKAAAIARAENEKREAAPRIQDWPPSHMKNNLLNLQTIVAGRLPPLYLPLSLKCYPSFNYLLSNYYRFDILHLLFFLFVVNLRLYRDSHSRNDK
jgi:hypothetical protein